MINRRKRQTQWRAAIVLATSLVLLYGCALFNQPPTARISASVHSGTSPLVVLFDASASSDLDGAVTSYQWNFGDSETSSGSKVPHTFITTNPVEVFTVTLTVTDDDGATSQATQTIEVNTIGDDGQQTGTDMPTARFMASKSIGINPLTVTFDASNSTPGTGAIVAYNWNFGDDSPTVTGARVEHTFTSNSEETTTYSTTLFVWNSTQQVDAEEMEIIVIVPGNDTGDEPPGADIFVTGPTVIYESDDYPNVPSLFEVNFDPRGSYADAGHSIDYFVWDFGDGDLQVETSNLEVVHIYELASPVRIYMATLTVFDDQGLEGSVVVNITLYEDDDTE